MRLINDMEMNKDNQHMLTEKDIIFWKTLKWNIFLEILE